jgi:hypothetical protein
MQNPWLDLPSEPPYIASVDAPILQRKAAVLDGDFQLRLDLLPQPWTGNIHTAEVLPSL